MHTNVPITGKGIIGELKDHRDECLVLEGWHFDRCSWWAVDDYLDGVLNKYTIHTEAELQWAIDQGALEACRILLMNRRPRPQAILPVVAAFLDSSVDTRRHLNRGIKPTVPYKPQDAQEFLDLAALGLIEFGHRRGFIECAPRTLEVLH